MIYNKLVRDKIPAIIESQGQIPHTRILTPEEYTAALARKLDEEVGEFHAEQNLEELADILEVVYALAENLGHSKEELQAVYQRKHDARGGFRDRIYLISKEG
jgi:predicted house-cleaning noncanonical NTP pyrophosphatase (MazG superfamily)